MKIALDWDGTVTADQKLFAHFATAARARGHKVFIVTMRYEHEPVNPEFVVDGILYTGRKAKKKFAANAGMLFDIWVDDNPEFLFNDARA